MRHFNFFIASMIIAFATMFSFTSCGSSDAPTSNWEEPEVPTVQKAMYSISTEYFNIADEPAVEKMQKKLNISNNFYDTEDNAKTTFANEVNTMSNSSDGIYYKNISDSYAKNYVKYYLINTESQDTVSTLYIACDEYASKVK